MKATKKIVGAACALVAAVALSAGSTFAWFASNDKATATGMKMQATAPTNLYIEKDYISSLDSINKTTIDLSPASGDAAIELKPAAISNAALDETTTTVATGALTGGKAYVGEAATYETGSEAKPDNAGVAKTYDKIGTFTAAMGTSADDSGAAWTGEGTPAAVQTEYVYSQDMTLGNKSGIIDVTAKVEITVPTPATGAEVTRTSTFLRVGFIVGTTDGTTTTYTFVSEENDMKVETGNIATGTKYVYADSKITVTYANLLKGFQPDTIATITFLVWFDGNDTDCYVNNANSLDEFVINIEYKAVEDTTKSTSVSVYPATPAD